MNLLDDPIVLKLNRVWMRLGYITPRQAFTALCGGAYGGTDPFRALPIDIVDGEMIPGWEMPWDEWVKLPVRDCDFSITTGRGQVRVPMVVVAPEFDKMPLYKKKFSGQALRARDGGRCMVSGRELAPGEGNVGHIKARALGGARTWENTVYMDKRLNTLQGIKTPEEMGWTLLTEPKAPEPIPAHIATDKPKQPEHLPFFQ